MTGPDSVTDKRKLIWVVDSDPEQVRAYERMLSGAYDLRCFTTRAAYCAAAADDAAILPSLILAETHLQDGALLEPMPAAALMPKKAPFVVVSTVDDPDTIKSSFAHGALDYVTKPFRSSLLAFKIEQIMDQQDSGELCSDRFLAHHGLIPPPRKETVAPLTQKERQIIAMLQSAQGRAITRMELLQRVWGTGETKNKTLDVHLHNLRKKIAPVGLKIQFNAPDRYVLQRVR